MNRAPIAQQLRGRTDKWDCIKLKSFCKENSNWTEKAAYRIEENFCQMYI
jgi:hypothetical protein